MSTGDTLYILGKHLGGYGDRGWGNASVAGIVITGLHPSYPLEQGVITNAFISIDGAKWAPSATRTGTYEYAIANLYGAIEYDSTSGYSFLKRVDSIESLVPSSFYRDLSSGFGYWMPSDGVIHNKKFLLLGQESDSSVMADNITIENLRFIGSPIEDYKHAILVKPEGNAVKIKNNYFRFCRSAIGSGANVSPAPDDGLIEGNLAQDGKIFLYFDTNDDPFKRWIVQNNTVLNMSQIGLVSDRDNEVFYMQGVQDSVFKHNIIDGYAGGAIDFYALSTPAGAIQISGNIVEKNIIKNGRYIGYGNQMTGLLVSADNSDWDSNNTDPFYNNVFRYNVIENLDADNKLLNYYSAIRIKARKPKYRNGFSWLIYNNLVYNASNGMYAVEVNEAIEGESDVFLVNNIFFGVDNAFLHFPSGNPSGWFIDHNIWSGVVKSRSFVMTSNTGSRVSYDYPEWIAALVAGGARGSQSGLPESNSLNLEPNFVDPKEGNFRLSVGSPGIDSGMNVITTQTPLTDMGGISIPSGAAPDIGPFEFNDVIHPSISPPSNLEIVP
jgi:hypothetical protein